MAGLDADRRIERVRAQEPIRTPTSGGMTTSDRTSDMPPTRQHVGEFVKVRVPPAGFEPAHRAPEARALSPELRGLEGVPSHRSNRPARAQGRASLRGRGARLRQLQADD